MKNLIVMLIMVLALVMPMTVHAGDCYRYFDELIEQSFEVTLDEIDFTLYFSNSVYGPCPGGIAVLSYEDLEFDCDYTTTTDIVTVEGLEFILFNGKLILLPDEPLILEVVRED